jgi:hypothetical protein
MDESEQHQRAVYLIRMQKDNLDRTRLLMDEMEILSRDFDDMQIELNMILKLEE